MQRAGVPNSLGNLLQGGYFDLLVGDDALQRLVLASQLFELLDVVGFQPAALGPPAVEGLLGDLKRLGHLGDLLALPEHPVGRAELADDLLGRMPASLHVGAPSPGIGAWDSHSGWTDFRRSGQM